MKTNFQRITLVLFLFVFSAFLYYRSTLPEDVPLITYTNADPMTTPDDIIEPTFALSSDSRYVASIGEAIAIFDRNERKIRTFPFAEDSIVPSFVLFTPDGKQLVEGGSAKTLTEFSASKNGGSVRVWDIASGQLLRTFAHHQIWGSAALSSNGKLLAVYGGKGRILCFDITSGKSLGTIAPPPDVRSASLAFSADGKYLVAAYFYDGEDLPLGDKSGLIMYDVATRKVLWSRGIKDKQTGLDLAITSIALSKDGKMLAAAGLSNTLIMLDAHNGKEIRKLTRTPQSGLHADDPQTVDFSPNGQLLAWGGSEVDLWNVADGSLRCSLNGTGVVMFSSDGNLLISRSTDIPESNPWPTETPDDISYLTTRTIKIWDHF